MEFTDIAIQRPVVTLVAMGIIHEYTNKSSLGPYFKRALTNKTYWKSYAAWGATGFLLAIYICEWEYVGKHIPVWNKYRFSTEQSPWNDWSRAPKKLE
ncbi:Protein F57B10.14 [Aphelenchoides avenae]|nr:Protein F57B10.14 [Aphelenchus avenae]